MIAYFDDTLGSPAPSAANEAEFPLNADGVASALELCAEARDCLIRASKTVSQLYRAAADLGEVDRLEELRDLRMVLWESRALVDARILTLRQVQSGLLTPLE